MPARSLSYPPSIQFLLLSFWSPSACCNNSSLVCASCLCPSRFLLNFAARVMLFPCMFVPALFHMESSRDSFLHKKTGSLSGPITPGDSTLTCLSSLASSTSQSALYSSQATHPSLTPFLRFFSFYPSRMPTFSSFRP